MTPPATSTSESRSTRTGPARGTGKQAAGHQRTIRSQPSPRRVSGPLRGQVAEPAVPRRTRRVKVSPAPRRRLRTSARPAGLRARLTAFIRSLPDHALLDRVVRGRAWIPLLGLMLAGIVAMQVEVLKLGAGIGRSIERGSALQSRNDLLRASVASLADDQRIERLAAGMGMVMPAPTSVGFLSARAGGSALAIPKIQPPDSITFMASLAALAAAAQQSQPVTSSTQTSSSAAPTGTTASTAASTATSSSAVTPAGTATTPPTAPSAPAPVQAAPPASSSAGATATGGG